MNKNENGREIGSLSSDSDALELIRSRELFVRPQRWSPMRCCCKTAAPPRRVVLNLGASLKINTELTAAYSEDLLETRSDLQRRLAATRREVYSRKPLSARASLAVSEGGSP
jgi:hypothetical protein